MESQWTASRWFYPHLSIPLNISMIACDIGDRSVLLESESYIKYSYFSYHMFRRSKSAMSSVLKEGRSNLSVHWREKQDVLDEWEILSLQLKTFLKDFSGWFGLNFNIERRLWNQLWLRTDELPSVCLLQTWGGLHVCITKDCHEFNNRADYINFIFACENNETQGITSQLVTRPIETIFMETKISWRHFSPPVWCSVLAFSFFILEITS